MKLIIRKLFFIEIHYHKLHKIEHDSKSTFQTKVVVALQRTVTYSNLKLHYHKGIE